MGTARIQKKAQANITDNSVSDYRSLSNIKYYYYFSKLNMYSVERLITINPHRSRETFMNITTSHISNSK